MPIRVCCRFQHKQNALMKFSPSRETILKRIREALSQSTPFPYPQSEVNNQIYYKADQEPELEFAENFNQLGGRFVFCVNRQEFAFQLSSLVKKQNWHKIYSVDDAINKLTGGQIDDRLVRDDLERCDASITGCECLVARTGSVVMSAAEASGRSASVYAPVHICIAFTHQLVYDIADALQFIKGKYKDSTPSLITFATGPSRTADIEKTLVTGVHGPGVVYCFLIDE